jgi:hypothetical protein
VRGRLVAVMWDGDPDCRACDLRDAGWHVVVADGDSDAALAVIRAEAPDGVLVDLDRQPGEGCAVASGLNPALPVIFVGGDSAARAGARFARAEAQWTAWPQLEGLLAALLPDRNDPA